jgi:hypothetical protein
VNGIISLVRHPESPLRDQKYYWRFTENPSRSLGMKDYKAIAIAFTAGALTTALASYCLIFTAMPGAAESRSEKEIQSEFKALQLTCPKCNKAMEYGFPDDYYEGGGNSWDQAYWSATSMGKLPFSKSPPQLRICSFRCVNCGYLESYAK